MKDSLGNPCATTIILRGMRTAFALGLALGSPLACTGGAGETGASTGSTSGSGSSGGGTGCPPGQEGCPCAGGGQCQGDLSCVGGTCANGVCGDGVVQGSEECDVGDLNADDGVCKSDCTNQVCGDGKVGPGEGCDDGNSVDDDACTNACKLATCGDGKVDAGEACDDGNDDETDGCTSSCTLPSCGDGFVQADEACDDGNGSNADACVGACELATCGDGFVWEGKENCDDGNSVDDDLCSNTCAPASCGDGVVQAVAGEICDDGNGDQTDACLSTCIPASCGDGFVQAGVEGCDDGNDDETDACLSTCAPASCGDGFVQAGVEPCDDGNGDQTDACLSDCTPASCGDGFVQAGVEACDDQNTNDGDGCTSLCFKTPKAVKLIQDDGVTYAFGNTAPGNNTNVDQAPTTTAPPRCITGIRSYNIDAVWIADDMMSGPQWVKVISQQALMLHEMVLDPNAITLGKGAPIGNWDTHPSFKDNITAGPVCPDDTFAVGFHTWTVKENANDTDVLINRIAMRCAPLQIEQGLTYTVSTGAITETAAAGKVPKDIPGTIQDTVIDCPDGHVVTWQRDWWVYDPVGIEPYDMHAFEFRCAKVEIVL